MTPLIVAMTAFVGGHILLSGTGLRPLLVSKIGERGFAGVFSLYAIATLVGAIAAFGTAPQVTLWHAGNGLRWFNVVLVALAILLVLAGTTSRGPRLADTADGGTLAAKGIFALTRHPMSWGIALWATGHVLVNGDLAALIFFGGFALLGLAASASQDRKKRAKMGASWDRIATVTSFVPLVAIAQGRARTSLADIGWWRLGVSVILLVGLLALHPLVIGISPLPV